MSSSPAIMRSVVDLPHPDGPTKTMNSCFLMSEGEIKDGLDVVVVDLVDVTERDVSQIGRLLFRSLFLLFGEFLFAGFDVRLADSGLILGASPRLPSS
jgi:hypothetical protein